MRKRASNPFWSGGAVVAIYSKGAYKSGDLDLVSKVGAYDKAQAVLECLGFNKVRSRHFEHPECPHHIIEFPPGPVSIGDDSRIQPSEVNVDGQILRILSPTDCIRDRLASYIHFNARECLDQAVLVARSQPFDLSKVRKWCESEGGREAFSAFQRKLAQNQK